MIYKTLHIKLKIE